MVRRIAQSELDKLRMNILLISHCPIWANSGLHVFNIANELCRLGATCVVSTPQGAQRVDEMEGAKFKLLDYGSNRIEDLFENGNPAYCFLLFGYFI